MSEARLTIEDHYFITRHLLSDDNRALLMRTATGPHAIPHLERLRETLAHLTDTRPPYADELADADRRHDAAGGALLHLCVLYRTLAALPGHEPLAELADRITGALVLDRALFAASYRDEANAAARNRVALPALAPLLEGIPVVPGLDARALAERFVEAGEEIGRLLQQRAETQAEAGRVRQEEGQNVRHRAQRLIGPLREAITAELGWRDDLPADLTSRLFGVIDQRIADANRRARGKGKDPAGAEPGAGEGAPVG